MTKPLIVHLNPVRYGQTSWNELEKIAEVIHIDEYSREQFIQDLHGKFSQVVAIARGYLTGKLVGRFDEELASHFPTSLKFIAHQGAGYDQVDVETLTLRGIQLSNCPNIVSASTADTNIYLMLGAMRNFEAGRRNLSSGKWPTEGFGAGVREGINPAKKILGIIGMGSIGRAVRDRIENFNFERIVYFNRSKLAPTLEKNCTYISSLEELVSIADVISINCPLNSSTHHLIDDALISKMKDGVIIVNTSRGAVINEEDMIKHLKLGKIGAVGLDVFENEPKIPKELLEMPNVLALPHMGTHAVQTVFEMEKWVIENIRAGLSKGRVISIVSEQKDVLC